MDVIRLGLLRVHIPLIFISLRSDNNAVIAKKFFPDFRVCVASTSMKSDDHRHLLSSRRCWDGHQGSPGVSVRFLCPCLLYLQAQFLGPSRSIGWISCSSSCRSSCHGTSCHGTSCHGTSCHGTSCHRSSCHGTSCHGTPRHSSVRLASPLIVVAL